MKLTIGVMGASGGDLPQGVRERAYELGEAVAERDAVLITGGCLGRSHGYQDEDTLGGTGRLDLWRSRSDYVGGSNGREAECRSTRLSRPRCACGEWRPRRADVRVQGDGEATRVGR